MIIEIHDSITAGLNHLTDDENNALVGLALSRSRGYNFIIASKKILTSIISIKDLGKMSIATYRKIYTDQVRWNNLLKSFSFRVRIVSSNQKISTQYENNVEILQIPLKDLLFYKLDDRASLIAENLTDIDFYTRVSMSYLKHKNIVIGYSYNEINGGGDTTKEVVKKHYQSNNGVSLCILDSDFKTPWSTYGTTAQG
ncbi:hypothetical protein FM037_16415 [Shewanella psychropiezotolerans]|uniref:Uncharacterized protein n=1 Tax=Shewanella psychropiezotolerans TaxID=2593655 RepID=A0ABX5WZG9_9GAMM|nr:hypothetical protein [Shewanella psychropiezotolerans]QDO84499.1 hypothetical protein FM037_16415 [Shewanella psychropiezotolerans]